MAILSFIACFFLVGGGCLVGENRGFGIGLLVVGAILALIAFRMVKPPYR